MDDGPGRVRRPALHLSQQEQLQLSWPVELIGHHAPPRSSSILYQEYPSHWPMSSEAGVDTVALMATALAYVTMETSGLLAPQKVGTFRRCCSWGGLGTALLVPADARIELVRGLRATSGL